MDNQPSRLICEFPSATPSSCSFIELNLIRDKTNRFEIRLHAWSRITILPVHPSPLILLASTIAWLISSGKAQQVSEIRIQDRSFSKTACSPLHRSAVLCIGGLKKLLSAVFETPLWYGAIHRMRKHGGMGRKQEERCIILPFEAKTP